MQWFLFRTRAGLVLRAVGESPQSAHAIGYPVIAIRYAAVLFGGACAGLGGAYLALAYTPMWTEGMTAGRGWIALALVVFATWKPWRVLAGAYLFGGVTLAQFQAQAMGVDVPVAIPGDAALCRDHRRAGDHLARRDDDPPERAGVARPAVPRRYLNARTRPPHRVKCRDSGRRRNASADAQLAPGETMSVPSPQDRAAASSLAAARGACTAARSRGRTSRSRSASST